MAEIPIWSTSFYGEAGSGEGFLNVLSWSAADSEYCLEASHALRSSQIDAYFGCRFVIIPDMLKNAPMFKRIDPKYRVRVDASATWLSH